MTSTSTRPQGATPRRCGRGTPATASRRMAPARPPGAQAPGGRCASGPGSGTTPSWQRRTPGSRGWTGPTAVTARPSSLSEYFADGIRWWSATASRTCCPLASSTGSSGAEDPWVIQSSASTSKDGLMHGSPTMSPPGTTTTTGAGAPSMCGTCTSTSRGTPTRCHSSGTGRRVVVGRRARPRGARPAASELSARGSPACPPLPPWKSDRHPPSPFR
mmetsp:Transcript_151267/g.466568  ORF Transcript_151267/g.466568 Transcript_151267/m.466568 type:complete len:217 (-) Transcript_151267:19-669(-)